MSWTKQKLAQYIDTAKVLIEFKGIGGEELEKAFHDEAVERLNRVRDTICNGYMDDKQKLNYIWEQILEE